MQPSQQSGVHVELMLVLLLGRKMGRALHLEGRCVGEGHSSELGANPRAVQEFKVVRTEVGCVIQINCEHWQPQAGVGSSSGC